MDASAEKLKEQELTLKAAEIEGNALEQSHAKIIRTRGQNNPDFKADIDTFAREK